MPSTDKKSENTSERLRRRVSEIYRSDSRRVSAGRFKAIDTLRRRARFDAALGDLIGRPDSESGDPATRDGEDVGDDRLRLVFICCHPTLSPEAQTALTLREVCGLTTEDVARAFLVPPPTLAQRIVRA